MCPGRKEGRDIPLFTSATHRWALLVRTSPCGPLYEESLELPSAQQRVTILGRQMGIWKGQCVWDQRVTPGLGWQENGIEW